MATDISLVTPSGRALCINEPNQNKLAVSHPFYCSLMIDLLMLWCLFSFTCYLSSLSLFWQLIYLFLLPSLFLALSNKCSTQSCFSSDITEKLALYQSHTMSPNVLHKDYNYHKDESLRAWGITFSKPFRKLVLKANLGWRTKCPF